MVDKDMLDTLNTQATSSTEIKAGGSLLIVDDEENILNAMRRLFRPLGYSIFLANSGVEGLKILEQEYVDLVISDMRMPEMDGAAFLEQVSLRWPDTIRILLTGYADVTKTIDAINKGRIYKYISKPWEENDLKITIKHALDQKFLEKERNRLELLTKQQNEQLKDLNANLENKVKARTEELQQTTAQLEAAHESLKKSYTASVKVFANLVELREKATAGHSRRVAEQALKLGMRMGLGGTQSQDLLFAALLHDIGKIGLPDKLITKPFHAMVQTERVEVIKHPLIGQAILMSLEPLQEAAKIIRCHHEQYDGKGYPDGLKREEIPLGARILSVVNDFDALQNGSLWSQRMSAQEAREYMVQQRGKRYDPGVVDAFFAYDTQGGSVTVHDKTMALKSNGLRPGMVLARDLMTNEGILLLSKGYTLDDKLIQRILNIEKSLDCNFVIYIKKNH